MCVRTCVMAPFIPIASSKADRTGEELLLELDALNQALQSRSHTRSKSLTSYGASPLRASESKPSCKRILQPRPSFKVPFRSTSISCDRPRRLLSSSSTKQSRQHHSHTKKEATARSHTEKEEDFQLQAEEVLQNCNHHENGHQHHKSRGLPHGGKGGPPQKEEGQQHTEKEGSQYDQIHQNKSIWRWRPLRALSHVILGSRCHLNVLFSLQVCRIENLPVSMNGLSLTVLWIFKSHCLRTRPSKIVNGIADFGEILQHQSTIHSTHCPNNISRYDVKWCTLSIMVPSLGKLELARNYVDLSSFLPQDDTNGNLWQDKCNDASYEMSGMAKGGTLIVTFSHHLAQKHSSKASHGTQSTTKKTDLLAKSLSLSNDVASLVESKTSSSSCLSEHGATSSSSCLSEHGAAVHVQHSMGHPTDTIKDSFNRDEVYIGAHFSSHDYSDSFEFKPPLKDNHLVEFSFSHTHLTTDNHSKKYMTTLSDEGLPPFSRTIHAYEDLVVEGEVSKSHKWPEHFRWQKQCESSQNRSPASGCLSFEVGRCIRQPKTDFDDDLDSVAEEFLNMLGMGLDAGHHNSEADSESPRERLLKQFEVDSLFMEVSQ